jgi:hypothetical protein
MRIAMTAYRSLTLAAALTIVLAGAAFCATDEELAKTIETADVLPKGWTVAAKMIGKEVVISTFRAPDANTTDCKIDASMIAKLLMIDHDFGVSRVRVQFHEPAGTTNVYQQVSVSLAEVKGFAAGVVTKDQFLDSLEVEKLQEVRPEPPKVVETTAPSAAATAASSAAINEGAPLLPSPQAIKSTPPPSVTVSSKRIGINFKVPAGWEAQELSSGPTILRLSPKGTKLAGIEISFNSGNATPAQRAQETRANFSYNGVSFLRYFPNTNFGTGPYPGSLIVLTYPHESHVNYYDMNLYFGNYKVWAWCDVPSYPIAGPAFDQILRTMTFPAKKKSK